MIVDLYIQQQQRRFSSLLDHLIQKSMPNNRWPTLKSQSSVVHVNKLSLGGDNFTVDIQSFTSEVAVDC